MSIAEPGEPELALSHDRAFVGHPKGLGYLSFTEACERFSYYSMQTLLVLYMVKYLLLPEHAGGVIGLDWVKAHVFPGLDGQPLASAIFGTYTALVYGTPLLGGIVADKLLGRRTTMIVGGLAMALGHFLMAFEASFLFALFALVVGVGFFKGNIASQVGALYSDTDLRRAMAFQIFYIFINGSVIIAPLISGSLGQNVGWHWGFGCAGVVMVLGLAIYLSGTRYLPPDNLRRATSEPKVPLTGDDWKRIVALLLLVPVLAVALLTNQEIFNAYLVWGDAHFQLNYFGRDIPSSWLITLDAILSFLMLGVVAAFWNWRGKRGWEPDELGKMIIGSIFTMAGGLCLFLAAATQGSGKISLFWPVMFHLRQLDRLRAHPAGQSGAVHQAVAQIDHLDHARHLLPRLLLGERDRRLCRRALFLAADDDLLAAPRCQCRRRPGGVHPVQTVHFRPDEPARRIGLSH